MRVFFKAGVFLALVLAFSPLRAQAQLLVTSFDVGQVRQYTNEGAFVGQFAAVGSAHNVAFDATGNAYISNHLGGR